MSPASRKPARRPKESGPRISAGQTVSEVIALLPEAAPVLGQYGLHCFSCSAAGSETLADGCFSHGFSEPEVDALVAELNELLRCRPPRPQTLTVTREAAVALQGLMESEGRAGQVLVVTVDEAGRFCLEFAPKTPPKHKLFTHREVPDVAVVAAAETLERVGGATIDLRDGRFKLDLPGPAVPVSTCSCQGGKCNCRSEKRPEPKPAKQKKTAKS